MYFLLGAISSLLIYSICPGHALRRESDSSPHDFDYIIVGGGTAGSVLANRLSEDPSTTVAVVEGGPSDVGLKEIQVLKNWLSLLETKYDYKYAITEQPYGNSHIIHSRAKVLGGCSSHNTLISFHPFSRDLDDWAELGNVGWSAKELRPYASRIMMDFRPAASKDRNEAATAWVASAANATGADVVTDFNAKIAVDGFKNAAGFLSIAYDPHTGYRRSASVAYLHPIMGVRQNLHLFLETWVFGLVFDEEDAKRVWGVRAKSNNGDELILTARKEVILSAGAIDSPRLLLLSGIGPARELEALGINSTHDLPGVGENLMDHVETIIMWNASSTPQETVMYSDAALFHSFNDSLDPRPDLMSHIYQIPFTTNTERLGYPRPAHAFAMTPNVPRPRSRGKLALASADPSAPPLLDFRYFTDRDGEDAALLVRGIRLAREIAKTAPFSAHIGEEIFPGAHVTDDEQLSFLARRASNTVYHSSGTCKMGPSTDHYAVVDDRLRVRGLQGLRIVDASVFPILPSVNPMITVVTVAEKAADLIKKDRTPADSRRGSIQQHHFEIP